MWKCVILYIIGERQIFYIDKDFYWEKSRRNAAGAARIA